MWCGVVSTMSLSRLCLTLLAFFWLWVVCLSLSLSARRKKGDMAKRNSHHTHLKSLYSLDHLSVVNHFDFNCFSFLLLIFTYFALLMCHCHRIFQGVSCWGLIPPWVTTKFNIDLSQHVTCTIWSYHFMHVILFWT